MFENLEIVGIGLELDFKMMLSTLFFDNPCATVFEHFDCVNFKCLLACTDKHMARSRDNE